MVMKKKQLGIILSKLASIPKPRLKWESYTLDAESAAEMAYLASLNNDIRRKDVVDLGCGSGILAIAASLLGARMVVGVDIDKEAIKTAKLNAERVSAQVNLVASDISCVVGHFDTALMNPPFGAWRRGADIHFLKKALEISDVVYSLHKRSNSVREFLRFMIPQINGQIDKVYEIDISIQRTYIFHKKKRYVVKADFYRVLRKEA